MNVEQRSSSPIPKPKLVYDTQIMAAPYRVSFNMQKYVGLLRELKMSDKEINKLNVRISADVKHILAGRYSILPNRITINAGHFWYWYEKSVQDAEERVKTRTIPRHLMREAVRDPALRSANVSLNKSLHHESKHASEGALKLFGFALTDTSLALGTTALLGAGIEEVIDKDINPATLKGMAVMLGGMYASSSVLYFTPMSVIEHRARRFADKASTDQRFANIITLRPKR